MSSEPQRPSTSTANTNTAAGNMQQQKSPKQNDDSNGVICEPPLMFNRFRILSQNYRKNVFFAGDNESMNVVVLKMMPKKDEYDLKRELWVYQRLYSKTNWDDLMKTKGINIPTLITRQWRNYFEDHIAYFAATYEGHSLETLHRKYREKLSSIPISLLCQIAYKAIQLLRIFHEEGVLHRDVHPGNFVLKDKVLSLIDYRHAGSFKPMKPHHLRQETQRLGSLRSLCRADLNNRSYCRKDDLEALALMLVNLSGKILPWETRGYVKKCKTGRSQLEYMKKHHVEDALSKSQTLPKVFQDFLTAFQDHDENECEPDYDLWIAEFQSAELNEFFQEHITL